MKNARAPVFIALGLAVCVIYLTMASFIQRTRYQGSTHVYSNSVIGQSVFHRFFEKSSEIDLHINRLHFSNLQADLVQNKSSLLILTEPKMLLGKSAVDFLNEWVQRGGHLFLSFHSQQGQRNFSGLFGSFGMDLKIADRRRFKNYQVTALEDSALFSLENLGMYGARKFQTPDCPKEEKSAACYFMEKNLGRGKVFLHLGFPPWSNALLDEGNNRYVLAEIEKRYSKVIVDEYHHFFSEKSMGDLLREWRYSLPIFGILGVALLFIVFFREESSDFNEQEDKKIGRLKNFHEVYKEALDGVVSSNGAGESVVAFYAKFIEENFPEKKEQLLSVTGSLSGRRILKKDLFEVIEKLNRITRQALRERGVSSG